MLGVLIAGVLSAVVPPRYTSTTSMAFAVTYYRDSTEYSNIYQGALLAAERAAFYAPLVPEPRITDAVAQRVGEGLTGSQISAMMVASVPPETALLTIQVTDTSPLRAQQVAQAVAETVGTVVSQIEPLPAPGSPPIVRADVVQPASFSPDPVSLGTTAQLVPRVHRRSRGGCAGRAGPHRGPSTRALARATQGSDGWPVLSVVPRDRKLEQWPLAIDPSIPPARREAYRLLRVSLSSVETGSHQVVVVTSPRPGDGRTVVAANLAIALAQAGERVLLVEADLARPRLATLLGLDPGPGLVAAVGTSPPDTSLVQPWPGMFDVLAAGSSVDDPTTVLGRPEFSELVNMLRDSYDTVIIDAPPLLVVAEGVVLASRADKTVVVVGDRVSNRDDVERAAGLLTASGSTVHGSVLVQTAGRRRPSPAPGSAASEVSVPAEPPSADESSSSHAPSPRPRDRADEGGDARAPRVPLRLRVPNGSGPAAPAADSTNPRPRPGPARRADLTGTSRVSPRFLGPCFRVRRCARGQWLG